MTLLLDCDAEQRRLAPPPGHRGAGRLRRRDDRDHPPVLLAWCSTRSASPATPTPAPAWSRTSTTWSRRPSTTSTSARSPSTRAARPSATPRRSPSPAGAVGDPQARLEPADEDRSTPAGRRVSFARAVRTELDRRKRRLGILSYDDLLSQLADALADADAPAARADAPALADRAGRRVPGHRPGAVAGARPGVQRPRDDGADRRPQAGDLRVPRRRRHDLPRGRRDRHHPADAVGQLAQRRAAARLASSGCSPAPRSATTGSWCATSRPTTTRAGWSARRAGAVPGAGRAPRGARRGGPGCSRSARCARTIARDLALDVRRLLASGATFEGGPLRPRDVAVISYRHADLADVREALLEVGVPAVIAGGGSVFATPAARRVADPAGGARAAAPQRAGAVGRAHLLLRPHRRRARRARRRPHRRGRRHAARLGGAVHHPRGRRGARGRQRRRAARAGARRGRRRPPAHRPAPHRRGAARGRRSPSGTAWSRC